MSVIIYVSNKDVMAANWKEKNETRERWHIWLTIIKSSHPISSLLEGILQIQKIWVGEKSIQFAISEEGNIKAFKPYIIGSLYLGLICRRSFQGGVLEMQMVADMRRVGVKYGGYAPKHGKDVLKQEITKKEWQIEKPRMRKKACCCTIFKKLSISSGLCARKWGI